MKVLVVVVALVALGQIAPSCSGERSATVIGWVEEKRVDRVTGIHVVVIDHVEYEVPAPFWTDVRVGDLVKWDGMVWTIVRRASS